MSLGHEQLALILLEFADGKPLGERGAYWLTIHLANCYWKKRRVSFKKRLAWVQENDLDFATNPLLEASPRASLLEASPRIHRFWTEADQPWLFLAACLERKRYKEEGPGISSVEC